MRRIDVEAEMRVVIGKIDAVLLANPGIGYMTGLHEAETFARAAACGKLPAYARRAVVDYAKEKLLNAGLTQSRKQVERSSDADK